MPVKSAVSEIKILALFSVHISNDQLDSCMAEVCFTWCCAHTAPCVPSAEVQEHKSFDFSERSVKPFDFLRGKREYPMLKRFSSARASQKLVFLG